MPTRPVSVGFALDRNSPAAIAWARRHAAELVKNISDTTRDRIRDTVSSALEDQDRDVEDIMDEIDDIINDPDRAEVIARTETMRAVNEGQRQTWEQAVEDGLLTGTELVEWITTPDDRLCPICEPLDGQLTEIGGTFDVDGEELEGPPAHPRCRCVLGISAQTSRLEAAEGRFAVGDVVGHPFHGNQYTDVPSLPDAEYRRVSKEHRKGIADSVKEDLRKRDDDMKTYGTTAASWNKTILEQWGVKTVQEYEDKVEATLDKLVPDANVFVRMNIGDLNKVLASGEVQNAFQSGTSHGGTTAGGDWDSSRRVTVEQQLFGIPENASGRERPKYGYLSSGNGISELPANVLKGAGGVAVQLKDNVKERVTFTIGDSADNAVTLLPEGLGGGSIKSADFIPQPMLKPSLLAAPNGFVERPYKNIHSESEARGPITKVEQLVPRGEYVEAQIHGRVSVSDIKSITFDKKPAAALTSRLDRLGIKYSVAKRLKTLEEAGHEFHGNQWTTNPQTEEAQKVHDALIQTAIKIANDGDVQWLGHPSLTQAPDNIRGMVKANIVATLADLEPLKKEMPDDPQGRVELAQAIVDLWAKTSGDSYPEAIGMQHAVAAEFQIPRDTMAHLVEPVPEWVPPNMQQEDPASTFNADRAFARAEYENTQRWLKENNITSLSLYRGMKIAGDYRESQATSKVQEVTMQPASSWTTDRTTAMMFAASDVRPWNDRIVLTARVPAERILSTAVTGRGALTEAEVLVLGGKMNVNVVTRGEHESREKWQKRIDATFAS